MTNRPVMTHLTEAKALNKSVRLFGEQINPDIVISIIKRDFKIADKDMVIEIKALMNEIKDQRFLRSSWDKKILLLEKIGGKFSKDTRGSFGNACQVKLGEIHRNFDDITDFEIWIVQELIPQLLLLKDAQLINFINIAFLK